MAAFSGLIVTCHAGTNVPPNHIQRPVIGKAIWSQKMTVAGTTGRSAPESGGQLIFRIYATANAIICIAKEPDAVNGTIDYVTAGEPYDFEADPGDKLAWVLDA